jgi:hypothetical protein
MATIVPTTVGSQVPLVFLLYAARVAPVGSAGNLSGLTAVQPGMTVWLMMYYVVENIPRTVTRTTRYTVEHQGKTVFDVVYHSKLQPSDSGKYARYVPFTVPESQPLGRYVFRATLGIGGKEETKTWTFAVASRVRQANAATSSSPTRQVSFLLYAARVSTVNILGDLSGLATVHRGMTVWLMMFYDIRSVPQTALSTETYAVMRKSTTVFRATTYREVAPKDTGRSFLHTIYTVPRSLPYGEYSFRATLTIGEKSETKTWRFVVARW